MTEKLITRELLIEWNACAQGIQRFCELFPDGADLKTAIEVLVNDGHNDWGVWLFKKCSKWTQSITPLNIFSQFLL